MDDKMYLTATAQGEVKGTGGRAEEKLGARLQRIGMEFGFFGVLSIFLWCKRQLLPVSESSGDYSPFVCGGDLWGCISDIQKNGGAHQEGFLFAGSRIPFDWAFRLFYG